MTENLTVSSGASGGLSAGRCGLFACKPIDEVIDLVDVCEVTLEARPVWPRLYVVSPRFMTRRQKREAGILRQAQISAEAQEVHLETESIAGVARLGQQANYVLATCAEEAIEANGA